MNPETPTLTPEEINQNLGTPQTPADNHWITIASMAVFVLLSLAAVAFLYYQNQQLKTMLATYQTPTVTPSPTATPLVLVPADEETPAAGTCLAATGSTATVKLNIDIPSPRCLKVTKDQSLTLVNGTNQTVNLDYATFQSQIASGSSYTFPGSLGSIFASGVHRISTSLYSGSGPEIWLQ